MRLIDADLLLEKMKHRREYVGRLSDPVCLVEDAPAVDAVPVEWLRKYTATGIAPNGRRLTEGKERIVINRILNEWQKEQEARRWTEEMTNEQ